MRYVVIGASAAGVNAVRELRRLQPDAKILLVSKDEEIYSRCILHHYMGGIRTKKELMFVEEDFETRYRVDWRRGAACTGLDIHKKRVCLSKGGDLSYLSYDKLLLAAGSRTFLPPVEGLREAGGVFGFRNMEDVEQIVEASVAASHIVVMGGGLTGMDCVAGFLHMGKSCSLVELEERLLAKQLDERSASAYQKAFEEKGVSFYLRTGISRVCRDGKGAVASLILTDGRELPCDLLVVTAGVRSNIEFLRDTGIACDNCGLLIDQYGQTNVPDIYGAGDITGRSPIWPAAVKQGMVAASNMAGVRTTEDAFFASKSTMNFLGIPTMSLGLPVKPDDSYEEILEDKGELYRKVIHKNGRIYGAILQGDLSYAGVLTQLIAAKIDVSRVKKPLFEIDYSDFFHTKDNFEFYYDET